MDQATEQRIEEAKALVREHRYATQDLEGELLRLYNSILTKHGIATQYMIAPGTCQCDESPIGSCVYNYFQDPCHEDCIFCHESEDKK